MVCTNRKQFIPAPVVALIGCKRSGRTRLPSKIHQKEIALFLHSSTKISMACHKEKKKI